MSAGQEQEIAVAISYDGVNTPTVSASGEADVAAAIIEIARQHDVPIYQDAGLTRLLAQVELNAEIPEALYVAIAEVIAFSYRLKDRYPANWSPPPVEEDDVSEPVVNTDEDEAPDDSVISEQ